MNRIEQEKRTVGRMIGIYCRHHHSGSRGDGLCPDCGRLLSYAHARLDRCPAGGNAKRTCRQCTVHCYSLSMREAIRRVMRYSGPRMILHHPVDAIRHLLREFL